MTGLQGIKGSERQIRLLQLRLRKTDHHLNLLQPQGMLSYEIMMEQAISWSVKRVLCTTEQRIKDVCSEIDKISIVPRESLSWSFAHSKEKPQALLNKNYQVFWVVQLHSFECESLVLCRWPCPRQPWNSSTCILEVRSRSWTAPSHLCRLLQLIQSLPLKLLWRFSKSFFLL